MPHRETRNDQITRLYVQLHARLEHIVRRSVVTSEAIIDDACAFAWLQLVRGDVRIETALSWLATVAIREAWRLDRLQRRCDALPEHEPACLSADPLPAAILVREALEAVAALPSRQAEMVALHAGGHSYAEIAEQTGDSLRTVQRQLLRGKRRLAAYGT